MQLFSSTYQHWPIKHKISAIVILISGLLMTVMALAVTIEKNYNYKSSLVKSSTVLAKIIGANSTAALLFHDADTAHEILAAMKAEHNLIAACLYDEGGNIFTSYYNPNFHQLSSTFSLLPNTIASSEEATGAFFKKRFVDVIQPVTFNNRTIGYIALRTDLTSFRAHLEIFIVSIFTLSFLLFGLGILICGRLNRTIVGPITLLADAMKEVMLTRNYDLRVSKKHDDEVGVLIDGFNSMLTQLQKRDAELARHQDHLEALVETRTSELKFANQQLHLEIIDREEAQAKLAHAQKMEAIGTLAGGVAHDLNNILSGIVSYPDLLLLDMDEHSKLRRPIEIIRASGKRAAAIVQDLLTLARRGVKIAERVDLYGIVSDYLESPECQDLQKNHPHVTITLQKSQQSFFTTGSSLHLSKTVMNLVSNAAEAIPEKGTVEISLKELYIDSQPVDFSQWRKGPYVRLTIADTGIGIPEKHLNRIFEPFYSRKAMGRSGTGLGMAVVWGTVEDHNGYITVASKEGEGTTFQLFFPADTAPQAILPENHIVEKQLRGNKETILVVDDSPEQRQIASDILVHLGYSVITVSGGEEAVEYLRHESADLVLLDMLMAPGIDGLETFQRILSFKPAQKAVIASGFSQSSRVEEARALGVADYVLKPYTVMRIGQVVHNALLKNPRPCKHESNTTL